jgi:hypothetical protein
MCARRLWTSWCQVDLRLVPDQVVSPTRHSTDGVDVNNRRGDRRPDAPPVEAPPASAVLGGVSTLATTTGGEATPPSTAPCGGVAVRVSSASASPMTCGTGDLVQEGEDGVPRPPCGLVTGMHNKTSRKGKNLQDTT